MHIINIYIITINIISLITMGIDKLQAVRNKNRISEFSLLTLSTFGGSFGTLIGMIIFRHKIRKIKFIILVPILLTIQILVYINIK